MCILSYLHGDKFYTEFFGHAILHNGYGGTESNLMVRIPATFSLSIQTLAGVSVTLTPTITMSVTNSC